MATCNNQLYYHALKKYYSGFATTHVVIPGDCNEKFYFENIYFSYANEHQNQLTLGCSTIHAIFLLTVRRIWMFFSLKPSPSQGESSLKISARWGSPFRRS